VLFAVIYTYIGEKKPNLATGSCHNIKLAIGEKKPKFGYKILAITSLFQQIPVHPCLNSIVRRRMVKNLQYAINTGVAKLISNLEVN
jgi:hypothetical protein